MDPELYLNGTEIPNIFEAKFHGPVVLTLNCYSFHTSLP